MSQPAEYLVSLDLGSCRTRALVAEVRDRGGDSSDVRFLGFGEVESRGWRRASLTDLEQVTASIRKAVEQAEAMAGVTVDSAVVGVGGPLLQGFSSRSGITLSARPREVTRQDVRRVIEVARDLPLPKDREILHLVPEEFVLDSQEGVRDPMGLDGCHLEVKLYVITNSVAAGRNVVTAVNHAGILVETPVLEALATAETVLSPEERDLGVLVALLGAGTCELAAYCRGGLRMTGVVPLGGEHFTSDVAVGLHTSLADAELIKKSFGSVHTSLPHQASSFEVPGLGDRPSRQVSRRSLQQILEPRAQELMGFILEELRRGGLDQQLGAGVVLCGGGARLPGMCDLAESLLGVPARLGLPPKLEALPESLEYPQYATLVGLLLYGEGVRRLRAQRTRAVGHRWKNLLGGKTREGIR